MQLQIAKSGASQEENNSDISKQVPWVILLLIRK
jgi:hypothetical protein